MSGRVVHFELPYDDGDRVGRFYQEAFGWDVQSVPGMDYTLATTTESGERGPLHPGGINGGLMQRTSIYSTPMITIEVDDIDTALQTVERLGGTRVTNREQIGDMGFTGYFRDTEGNLVGLYQSASST